jgi:hypothetical protein
MLKPPSPNLKQKPTINATLVLIIQKKVLTYNKLSEYTFIIKLNRNFYLLKILEVN